MESPKWMSVFESPNGCWTVNWGCDLGPPISLQTIRALTMQYMESHRQSKDGVPTIIRFSWISACHHKDNWSKFQHYELSP